MMAVHLFAFELFDAIKLWYEWYRIVSIAYENYIKFVDFISIFW